MLFKQSDRLAIKGIVLTSLLGVLSSCGNSTTLENLVGADPALKKETKEVSDRSQSKTNANPNSVGENARATKANTDRPESAKSNSSSSNKPNADSQVRDDSPSEAQVSSLTLNFPDIFPVYPKAELEEIKSSEDEASGKLVWKTKDNRKAVADYYQAELAANNWDVIKPFTINPEQKIARAIAVKDNLRVELSLSQQENTKLAVVYHPLDREIPQSSISRWQSAAESEISSERDSLKTQGDGRAMPNDTEISPKNELEIAREPQSKPKLEVKVDRKSYQADNDFADLDEVPPQLQQPIESVAALNILTPYTGKANVELTRFAPNEVISRGEYARWLIAANNRYYADDPGKKIYAATTSSQPAFNDVGPNHADFEAIQSLAEAGLIPSRLTEDSTNLLFRPDAPLIREDLVTWKVPLDTRKSLPKASIEAIEESWGFQDAANIDSEAVRALYADFQNGDRSNVRRMFGYTTLFQPKKPVTRAEAAASLWYFGFQGDGITAKEALETEATTES